MKRHHLTREEIKLACLKARIRNNSNPQGKKCYFESCSGLPPYVKLSRHLKQVHGVQVPRKKPSEEDAKNEKIKTIVQKYEQYLCTLEGGLNSEKMAKQKAFKMRQIFRGCQFDQIIDIFRIKNEQTLQAWFLDYAQHNSGSSSITYMNVLINFVAYVYYSKVIHVAYDTKATLTDKIHKWQKNILKISRGEISYKKKQLDMEFIKHFHSSQVALEARAMLAEFQKGKLKITQSTHSLVRNYIILSTLLVNCCRPAVFENLTPRIFSNAVVVNQDNVLYYLLNVGKHKTVIEHGPATLVLTSDLYEDFNTYYYKVRPLLQNDFNKLGDSFFLTWSGKSNSSDDINKNLKSIWKRAGGTGDICSTLVRAASTTLIHQSGTAIEKELLARLLCHRVSTAEKFYRQETRSSEKILASKIVKKAFGLDQTTVDDGKDEVMKTGNDMKEMSPDNDSDLLDPTYRFDEQIDHTTENMIIENDPDPYENLCINESVLDLGWVRNILIPTGRGRITFTDEEKKKTLLAFFSFIEKDTLPTRSYVTKMINENPLLEFMKEQISKKKEEKIIGCIRNLLQRKKKLCIE